MQTTGPGGDRAVDPAGRAVSAGQAECSQASAVVRLPEAETAGPSENGPGRGELGSWALRRAESNAGSTSEALGIIVRYVEKCQDLNLRKLWGASVKLRAAGMIPVVARVTAGMQDNRFHAREATYASFQLPSLGKFVSGELITLRRTGHAIIPGKYLSGKHVHSIHKPMKCPDLLYRRERRSRRVSVSTGDGLPVVSEVRARKTQTS
jgi:hypothetical protein